MLLFTGGIQPYTTSCARPHHHHHHHHHHRHHRHHRHHPKKNRAESPTTLLPPRRATRSPLAVMA